MSIDEHKEQWPVRVMCEALRVHPSGYYAWSKRTDVADGNKDCLLVLRIRELHDRSKRSIGSRRLVHELRNAGAVVGRHKVRRLMREDGLQTRRTPRRFVVTTDSNHSHRIAPNLLNRNFSADAPNEKWCADFTYIASIPTSKCICQG